MGSQKGATDSTRDRLLGAACKVFGDKGFRDATIAEICEQAEANIAAVNYYFHDKESLYVEAWRDSFTRSVAAHPPDGGVAEDAPPEDRLRGRILALLRRIADDASAEVAIMHRELANPTGLLHEVHRDVIGPLRDKMIALMHELLGPGATDAQAAQCAMSIISQCMGLIHRKRLGRGWVARRMQEPGGVEALARHIATFSLAGIRAVASQGPGEAAAGPDTEDA